MERPMRKKGRIRSISYEAKVYAVCFVSIATVAFCPFLFGDKTFVWNVDGFKQYYPLLANFRQIITGLFHGEGISAWAPEIGLGGSTLGNISIILCDPFNYFVALFPLKHLDIGYTISAILRMYCAGYAMMSFLKYHGLHREMCVVGGLSYAFCAWAIGVIYHVFFLNPLVLFPLIILGIDRVMDGKRPHLLIVSVFFSLITYIYFAYMSAVFCFIYVLVKCWCTERTPKYCTLLFFKLSSYICISCMIASPVLLAMTYSILRAAKSSGYENNIVWSLKQYMTFIPALVSNTELFNHYSYIGIGAPLTLGIPLVLWRIKEKRFREYRILFLLSFAALLFPFWNRLMNGFSYAVGRWCYIYAFFAVAAVSFSTDIKGSISKKERTLLFAWVVVLFSSFVFSGIFLGLINREGIIAGIFNLLFLILLLIIKPQRDLSFYLAVILYLSLPILFRNLPGIGGKLNVFLSSEAPYEIYESSLLRANDELKTLDGDFYRVNFDEHRTYQGSVFGYADTPANDNLYWRSPTIYAYLSTFDSRLLNYSKSLSNSSGYYNRVSNFSNDNRARMDFLMGVKYYLYEDEKYRAYEGLGFHQKGNMRGVSVLESDYNPGLGYVFPCFISESWFETRTPLEKEELLMQGVVISEEYIPSIENKVSELDYSGHKTDVVPVSYQISEESSFIPTNNTFEISGGIKKLKLKIEPVEDSEIFVEFIGLKRIPRTGDELVNYMPHESIRDQMASFVKKVSTTDYPGFDYYVRKDTVTKRVVNTSGKAQGLPDIDCYMSNVGYYSEANGDIDISFITPGTYTYDELNVYSLPAASYRTQANELSNNRLTVTEFSNDYIAGTVDSEYSGFLYLCLIQDPGWKAFVDGEAVDIFKTDTCFMGFPIDSGRHEIQLIYKPVGYPYFYAACFLGVALFILLFIPYRKRIPKQ